MLQNILGKIFWVIIVLQSSRCRRYDIEQEAQTLYGTNLKSVIDRFRRTPEYLKILNGQVELLRKNTDLIMESTIFYYTNKLAKKIAEVFGGNETQHLRTIRKHHFKKKKSMHKQYRHKKHQRSGKGLDDYKKFHSTLSLEQKNRMKDLGFEYAGRTIHAMLLHILPDGALPISTLHPYGGDTPDKGSTLHHHDHEVTTPHSSPDTEATTESTDVHDHHTYVTDDQT